MKKITNTLQLVGGALAALILAPVIALFGLTILGLAIGAAALLTGTLSAIVWQQSRAAETAKAQMEAETAPETDTQSA